MAIPTPLHPDHEIFLLIADKRNISKAAESLGVGQSGLSKAVRRLEEQCGGALFARRNQGVELTRQGRDLYHALKLCRSAWQEHYETSVRSREVEGAFTVGGHPSVLSVFLPRALSSLLAAYPKVHFDVRLATSPETTRQVAALFLDFGLVVNHVRAADVIARRIGSDYLALWRLKGSSPPRWICYNPEMIDIGKLIRRFEKRRLVPIADYQIIREMMLFGESDALLPQSQVRHDQVQIVGKRLNEVAVSLIFHRAQARTFAHQAIASAWPALT
jgi:DNA-binding transcriptional LysR family regulator